MNQISQETLVEELLKQKAAHDALVDALHQRIESLADQVFLLKEKSSVTYLFFTNLHRELVPEFVEMAYRERPEVAKKCVSAFHDDTLDLSELPCTGDDFKPWG
jgi:hypothetical protein